MASLLQNNASSAVGSKAQHADVLQEEEESSYWDCEEKKKVYTWGFLFPNPQVTPCSAAVSCSVIQERS